MFLITSLLEGPLNEAVEKFGRGKHIILWFHCSLFLAMLASSSQSITVRSLRFVARHCSQLVMTSAHSLCYGCHCSVILPDAAKGYYSGGKVSL